METKYRTCQCESSKQVERQVIIIRSLHKRITKLVLASQVASAKILRIENENEELKVAYNNMAKENAILRRQAKPYHPTFSRSDANWPGRIEVSE